MTRTNSKTIQKEKNNNILSIVIFSLMFVGALTASIMLPINGYGWFIIVGPIALSVYSGLALIKSISLLISLKVSIHKYSTINVEIDIYRMWNLKKVTNFWDAITLTSTMIFVLVLHTIIMFSVGDANVASVDNIGITYLVLAMQIIIPIIWFLVNDQILDSQIKNKRGKWTVDTNIDLEAQIAKRESKAHRSKTAIWIISITWVLPLLLMIHTPTKNKIFNIVKN